MTMDKDMSMLRNLGGLKDIAKAMTVDLDEGIDTDSIEWRKKKWGENELPPKEEATLFGIMMDQFEDPMLKMLIGAAVVSLVLGLSVPDKHTGQLREGAWIEGFAILISVAIVAVVSAVNEWRKEQKFKVLSAAKPPEYFTVRRQGVNVKVLGTQLVQGDVVALKGGDTSPIDGLFIDGQDLKVDEADITGENIEISKNEESPFVVSGSSILEGECTALCIGVGVNCLAGRSAMRNREKKDKTPLEIKLDDLMETISLLGMAMALLTTISLFAKACWFEYQKGSDHFWEWWYDYMAVFRVLIECITVGITIVVVAVPEGLPLSVTIALAYSMHRMMVDQNLVRHLAACETMGGATQICSDKTGTLTQNKMTVVRAVFAGDTRPRKIPLRADSDYAGEIK
eukprot:gene18659-28804_t